MSDSENRQRILEAILKSAQDGSKSVERRLLKIARLGMDNPTALKLEEIQQVCFALVVNYYQLGID